MSLKSWNQRVLEHLGVLAFFSLTFGMMVFPSVLYLALLTSIYTSWMPILYTIWVIYDYQSINTGWHMDTSKIKQWLIKLSIWKHFGSYFPAQVVKTHDLDPTKSYIFACHPHGVYALHIFSNIYFSQQFQELFPGIETIASTLPINFFLPIWREFLHIMGTISCDKKVVFRTLKKAKQGIALIIAVGGGKEFRYMQSGTTDLVLKTRKGFVRLALKTGTALVPVLGFGENELFDKVNHPIAKKVGYITNKLGKFEPPFFVGRWGLPIPKRFPLVTVVGKPIPVEQIDNPTPEQIDALHQTYVKALEQLYQDNKDKYDKHRKHELRIVA
ncbi:diacylglycerol acyltransferase [Gorgonomyces haynaldii]|nr:diacylglycerol acyltransferase [Gorgonomyces haynaldii]